MKVFQLDGPTWAFFTPEQMYGEQAKLRAANKNYINADLYMLTRMNKIYFNVKKTKVNYDGTISAQIFVGNSDLKQFERKAVKIPLIHFTYEIPSFKREFTTPNHCFFRLLYRQYEPKSQFKRKLVLIAKKLHAKGMLPNIALFYIMRAVFSTEVRVFHDSPYQINVYDPLIECTSNDEKAEVYRRKNPETYSLNNADWDLEKRSKVDFSNLPGFTEQYNSTYMVDQIANVFEVDVGGQEVLYIGKTEQEDFARLVSHDKLNKTNALHLRDEYKANVVHLLGFRYCDIFGSVACQSNIKKSDAITIAEATLINYFKPQDNTHYVDDSGANEWKHRKLLKRKHYQRVDLLLDIDGQYTKFYTTYLGHKGESSHSMGYKV
ncbi:hypothetical protein [Vibrio pomeroyi]|uniref:hypothetical protein n=1 Tax=Vibrio pomeroyi TaxID=198832 RepID=UPI0021C4BDA8|nr:hypothetical protein [Vibrio pomeroyi]